MTTQDKRRILVSASALLAMPLLLICRLNHLCMGGHMAHPPYPWLHYANDIAWLSLLVIALVFAFRSNLPEPELFIGLSFLVLALGIIGLCLPTLILGGGLVWVSNHGLKNKDEETPSGDSAHTNMSVSDSA